jgi:beta-lactamase superfamily II metal-dependent hydrolase
MTTFSLTMHPGSDGDALLLRWGEVEAPHHALIDLGRKADYHALRGSLAKIGRLDLMVITHIDADHIEGAMPLVAEPTAPFAADDIWFNGHDHLKIARNRRNELEVLSVLQGEKLSDGIVRFGWPWNRAFDGGPVSTNSPQGVGPLDLNGLRLTLLSPDDAGLSALEREWDKALADAALRKGDPDEAPLAPKGLERLTALDVPALAAQPFKPDTATPNGSSIAFLAEHDGRRVLLAADAHPDTLAQRLRTLGWSEQEPLKLDLFKLSHHGSKANLSPELLTLIDCTRFAISTDGSRHNFPDPECIARILVADPSRDKTFYFNYPQKNAALWSSNPELRNRWRFDVVTPAEGQKGLTVDV